MRRNVYLTVVYMFNVSSRQNIEHMKCVRCNSRMLSARLLNRKLNVFVSKRLIFLAARRSGNENSAPESSITGQKVWTWRQPEGHDTGITIKISYYLQRKSKTEGNVPFIVRDPNYVTWYACGPTVYDSSHIGHASTYLLFDVIRRILTEYFGLKICMIMGITNMDNKIINRALLHDMDIMKLANKYEAEFKQDMTTLNVLPPTSFLRVTDVIPQIIDFIQTLLQRNLAYTTERGNVYLSYNDAQQSVAKLWKEFYEEDPAEGEKAQGGEPYWDAPWGKGRPGWHIECSVMASMCFGEKVDIHTGANDLRFPHHEYEIAQCDGFHGCYQWVDYFLHTGHLRISATKMSKSLGNFITIQDCVNEYEKDFLRMLCCGTRWYKNSEFDKPRIGQTLKNLKTFRNFFKISHQYMSGIKRAEFDNEKILKAIEECDVTIMSHFKDNFTTRGVINELCKLVAITGQSIKQPSTMFCDISALVRVTNYIDTVLTNLGFTFHRVSS